jgi:hypothetical protein
MDAAGRSGRVQPGLKRETITRDRGLRGTTPESALSLRLLRAAKLNRRVHKLCIFAGMTLVGYVAGYLVSGFGLMTEIIVSGIGSMVGVYLGWKLAQRIER